MHADSARQLVRQSHRGVLSTIDANAGTPYGSLVECVPLENGDVAFLLSDLAEHTENFGEDPRASLLVGNFGADNPLEHERAALMGEILPFGDEGVDQLREAYLEAHPHAEKYIDFSDFSFYRLEVERVRYIAGFGRMGWVQEPEYREGN